MHSFLSGRPFFKKAMIVVFAVPMLFFGGSYFGGLQDAAIARVGALEVPQSEFLGRSARALERYRASSGEEAGPETAALIRREVLNTMISEYLARASVREKKITAPDSEVLRLISETPDFQDEGGAFSKALFSELVTDKADYLRRVREAGSRAALQSALDADDFSATSAAARVARFFAQRRTFDVAVFPLESYRDQITPDEDEIGAYYDARRAEFAEPAQAQARYVSFSLDDFAAARTASEEEIADAYALYREEARADEGREVRHILLPADAADAAAALAAELAEGGDFAAAAAEHSIDAGSAQTGGALGVVQRGDLPPALDDAAFTMAAGQVRGPLESEDGLHLIKLDAVYAPGVRELADIKGELAREIRRDKAAEDFAAALEEAREIAFVELDRLAPVADALSTTVADAGWFARDPASAPPPFDSEDLLFALFDSAAVGGGDNTEPIAIGGEDGAQTYIIARAADYRPAREKPLSEVRDDIAAALKTAGAARLARADIEARIEQLNAGEELEWQSVHTAVGLSDDAPEGLSPADLQSAFAADISGGLPAFGFSPGEDAIKLLRVREVSDDAPPADSVAVMRQRFADSRGRLLQLGYLDYLSRQFAITVLVPPEEAAAAAALAPPANY